MATATHLLPESGRHFKSIAHLFGQEAKSATLLPNDFARSPSQDLSRKCQMNLAPLLQFLSSTVSNVTKRVTLLALALGVAGYLLAELFTPDNLPAQIITSISIFYLVIGIVSIAYAKSMTVTVFHSTVFVLFGVLIFVCIYFFPQSEVAIDVFLKTGDQQIRESFTLTYTISGRGQVTIKGENGTALIRGVPKSLKKLEVNGLSVKGYEETSTSPYPIVDGNVVIPLRQIKGPPPLNLEHPSDLRFPKDLNLALGQDGKATPSEVRFTVTNDTGDDLSVCLFNCSFASQPTAPQVKFVDFDIASHHERVFEQFTAASGWFVVFVKPKGRPFYRLALKNIFGTAAPRMDVGETDNADQPYTANFSGVDDYVRKPD